MQVAVPHVGLRLTSLAAKFLLPVATIWAPFVAGWANFALDAVDGDILIPAGLGGGMVAERNSLYQHIDKAADYVTYVCMVVAAWRWPVRRRRRPQARRRRLAARCRASSSAPTSHGPTHPRTNRARPARRRGRPRRRIRAARHPSFSTAGRSPMRSVVRRRHPPRRGVFPRAVRGGARRRAGHRRGSRRDRPARSTAVRGRVYLVDPTQGLVGTTSM